MGKLTRAAGTLGVAETQAFVALRGFNLHKQHGDFGHGLLPAGQHFGVADGVGQGQVAGGHLNPGDAVVAVLGALVVMGDS